VTGTLVVGVLALALVNFTIKAAGPVLLEDREPSPTVTELIIALSPALLAGLVTVELAGPRWSQLDWTLLPGLAAAGLAHRLGVPDLVCVAGAVAITAALRLVLG
jgi:hypothetical protein